MNIPCDIIPIFAGPHTLNKIGNLLPVSTIVKLISLSHNEFGHVLSWTRIWVLKLPSNFGWPAILGEENDNPEGKLVIDFIDNAPIVPHE